MIADTLLPQSAAIFSIDKRLVNSASPDTTEQIEVPRFYKGNSLLPCEIDHMYSEIVLMDMKLY